MRRVFKTFLAVLLVFFLMLSGCMVAIGGRCPHVKRDVEAKLCKCDCEQCKECIEKRQEGKHKH
jgi:hypothetical protein